MTRPVAATLVIASDRPDLDVLVRGRAGTPWFMARPHAEPIALLQ